MNNKVIFLDIDGTLTMPGSNEPPASALRAIAQARENGHRVFLCSGRNPGMLSPLLKFGFDGYVSSSGGYVVCGEDVIYDCPMTPEQQKTALESLQKNGVFRTVECRDASYTDESFKQFLKDYAGSTGNSELLRWREQLEQSLHIEPMEKYAGDPIYKVVMMFNDMAQLEEPKRLLEKDFAFVIQEQGEAGIINGELVNRSFDKGQGIRRVCEHLGMSIADSVGFGDSNNDREMLETVGLAICMENGSSEMKAIAHEIAPRVDEDGLYHMFVKHGWAL